MGSPGRSKGQTRLQGVHQRAGLGVSCPELRSVDCGVGQAPERAMQPRTAPVCTVISCTCTCSRGEGSGQPAGLLPAPPCPREAPDTDSGLADPEQRVPRAGVVLLTCATILCIYTFGITLFYKQRVHSFPPSFLLQCPGCSHPLLLLVQLHFVPVCDSCVFFDSKSAL